MFLDCLHASHIPRFSAKFQEICASVATIFLSNAHSHNAKLFAQFQKIQSLFAGIFCLSIEQSPQSIFVFTLYVSNSYFVLFLLFKVFVFISLLLKHLDQCSIILLSFVYYYFFYCVLPCHNGDCDSCYGFFLKCIVSLP